MHVVVMRMWEILNSMNHRWFLLLLTHHWFTIMLFYPHLDLPCCFYHYIVYQVVYPYVPGALWGSWVWPVATTLRFACVWMEDCQGPIGWDQLDEVMGKMGSWLLFTNTKLIRLPPGQTLIRWFFDLMAGLGTKNSSKWGAPWWGGASLGLFRYP